MSSKDMSARRLRICYTSAAELVREATGTEACGHLTHTFGVPRCLACGCFLDLKTKIASQSCPAGKWPAESSGLSGLVSRIFGGDG
jgi:hypothetical protein